MTTRLFKTSNHLLSSVAGGAHGEDGEDFSKVV